MKQLEIMNKAGFLSAAQVMDLIGASSVGSVHRMVKSGRLTGEHVGGRYWYVSADSLLKANAEAATIHERIITFLKANAIPHGALFGTAAKKGKRVRIAK